MKTKERILLYTDTDKLERIKARANDRVAHANEYVKRVETMLKTTLTHKERIEVATKGKKTVMAILKSKFQFPDATDDFNLSHLGIRLSDSVFQYREQRPELYDTSFKIDSNGSIYLDIENLPELETCYTYCENERQEIAYKLALKTINFLKELSDAGFQKRNSAPDGLKGVTDLINWNWKGIEPNIRYIKTL